MEIQFSYFNNLTPAELERLALLQEEMGEAQQIIGKILRHGYDSCNPISVAKIRNRDLLEEELGHVLFSIKLMVHNMDLEPVNISKSVEKKYNNIRKYLHHNDYLPDPGQQDNL